LSVEVGSVVVVFGGASPVGQMAALAAQLKFTNLHLVLAFSGPEERSIAPGVNAAYPTRIAHVLDVSDDSFVKQVKQLTKGKGADAVFNPTPLYTEKMIACVRDGKLSY